ncbi:MAG: HAMP domain-containing histidine kinase [Gemmatimonadetes bacterium]|nr:HAMP domain-containing histidine kinase [Gemmatimonadota bacterium]
MVDDLFTLARLDAEDHALLHETFFLEEVALSAVEGIRPLAEERRVSIQFTPPWKRDARAMRRSSSGCWTNLLDNAISTRRPAAWYAWELSALTRDTRYE